MSQELFHLDDNRFGSPATAAMSEEEIIQNLENTLRTGTLNFSGANLAGDSALFVADIIGTRGLYSFSTANFAYCGLRSQAFEQLASCFQAASDLQSLDLSKNDLTKEAGLSIASILGGVGKLEILDVSDNKLGDAGVASLTSVFDKDLSGLLPTKFLSILTLRVLDLSGNDLGDASILALSRGLLQFTKKSSAVNKPVALEVLRLDRNKLGDNAALCLAQLLQSSYATMHKSPRTTTFQLRELSISDNNIGEKGLIALLISVQETRDFSLKRLKMSRCQPTVAVLDQLAEVLAVQSGLFNALSVLELDFNLASAIKAVRDPDYAETLLRLSHAVTSYDHSLSSLSLGDLYAVTLHASTDPILSSNEHVKLNSALSRLDQLGAILKITDGLVIEGESKSEAETKNLLRHNAVSPSDKFPDRYGDTPNNGQGTLLGEKLDISEGYVAARVEELEQTAYQSPVHPPPTSSTRVAHIRTPYSANSAEHQSVLDYQQEEFQRMRQEQAVS
jgi:hypothetical protein